jgi:hypothetical protein
MGFLKLTLGIPLVSITRASPKKKNHPPHNASLGSLKKALFGKKYLKKNRKF